MSGWRSPRRSSELGIAIPDHALVEMRAHLDDADLDAAAAFEKRFRHDVMAHVHAFGEQAPAARPYLHLGATSAFVTDNADVLIIRDALGLVLGRVLERDAAHSGRSPRRMPPCPASPTPISSRPS